MVARAIAKTARSSVTPPAFIFHPMKSLKSILLCAALFTTASLHAQNYTEVGDAGSTPGTAQNSGLILNNGSVLNIFGTISGINDADVFILTLNVPALFSATTNNTTTNASGLDTQLFLFTLAGAPIYANDDANGFSLTSTLPAGTTFTTSLAAGTYLIAISLSGNNPVNSSNQLVFNPGVSSTDVRGPANGLNPATFSGFNSGATFAQSGAYQITIIPEPATWTLAVIGVAALGLGYLRKRRQTAL